MKKLLLLLPIFSALQGEINQNPDIKQKTRDIKLLTKKASRYLEQHDIYNACHVFSKDPSWRKGDLCVSIIKSDGFIYTNPENSSRIWENLDQEENAYFNDILSRMKHRSDEGGGWVIYPWQGNLKYAFVQSVVKDTESYYVTVGFYPQSKKFQTKQLVESVIDIIKDENLKTAINLITKPEYQRGAIHVEIYTEDGVCVGNGVNPSAIGQNYYDLKDAKGTPIIKQAIETTQEKHQGWIEYIWKNVKKRTFVKKYIDPTTQISYIIMSGYYPDIDKNMVPKFVKKAAAYIAINGVDDSVNKFNTTNNDFTQGPLEIILINEQGTIITDTYKGSTLDKNFFGALISETQKKGYAWEFGQDRSTEAAAYAEKITINQNTYYVASVYYLNSKKKSTEHFVDDAKHVLETQGSIEAFKKFCDPNGNFVQGDQYIFVYDMTGRCLAHGENMDFIQRDFSAITDQSGNLIIDQLINLARKQQGGWVNFDLRNSIRRTYIRRVDIKEQKETKSYIVGSGFWL